MIVNVESVQSAAVIKGGESVMQGDDPCFLCGKATRGERFVHLARYGGALVSEDETLNEAEDMGYFPVGPECAKKLDPSLVTTDTDWS